MDVDNDGAFDERGNTQHLSQPQHSSLKQLYAYWLSKKGPRIAPLKTSIKPAELRALLSIIALIEVIDNPRRFRFRLYGTKLVEAYGEDLMGKCLDEIDLDGLNIAILDQAEQVVRECCVRADRDHFTKQNGRHVEYDRLALPLSENGQTVDTILVGYFIERAYWI